MAYLLAMHFVAAAFTMICAPGARDNCVVDGDASWLYGEKVRIADIDTPELNGGCAREKALARQSRDRLPAILGQGFGIRRTGTDRYGRTLAIVMNGRGSVGGQLVHEGLARTWTERGEGWC